MSSATHMERPGILVLSHGPLCTALIESARMIAGDVEGVQALPLEPGRDVAAYADQACALLDAMPEGSIVLFDLFAGTPFNQVIARFRERSLPALCGVSLPMLLDANTMRETLSGQELIRAVEESAHESLVNVADFLSAMQT